MWIGLIQRHSRQPQRRSEAEPRVTPVSAGITSLHLPRRLHVGYGADPGARGRHRAAREVEAGAAGPARHSHDAAYCSAHRRWHEPRLRPREAIDWTRSRTRPPHSATFLTRLPLTFGGNTTDCSCTPARTTRRAGTTSPAPSKSRAPRAASHATRAQATFCGHVHVPQLYHRCRRPARSADTLPVQGVDNSAPTIGLLRAKNDRSR